MSEKTKERFIGLGSTFVVMLVSFYFGSFASDRDVEANSNSLKALKVEVQNQYAKKEEVTKVKTGIKILASGLCIMEPKTCSLKKDLEKELK